MAKKNIDGILAYASDPAAPTKVFNIESFDYLLDIVKRYRKDNVVKEG